MKHKYADLIHAWADGADIEIYVNGRWENYDDIDYSWNQNYPFRIKPEEKKSVVRWLWCFQTSKGSWEIAYEFATEEEAATRFKTPAKKLEWSRTEFPE